MLIHSMSLITQAVCSRDYEQWLQTMYTLFGTKFSKLFCGPMWSQAPTSQGGETLGPSQDPLKVFLPYMLPTYV